MSTSPNPFVWYELMTTAAEAFYRAVIGWGVQDWGQPDMRYIVMSAGEKMVAGLMPLPAEVGATGGPVPAGSELTMLTLRRNG